MCHDSLRVAFSLGGTARLGCAWIERPVDQTCRLLVERVARPRNTLYSSAHYRTLHHRACLRVPADTSAPRMVWDGCCNSGIIIIIDSIAAASPPSLSGQA